MSDATNPSGVVDHKQCPFCAETIKAAATFCKHCRRDLPRPEPPCARCLSEGRLVPLVTLVLRCPVCGGLRKGDDNRVPCQICVPKGQTVFLTPALLKCPACGATRSKKQPGMGAGAIVGGILLAVGVVIVFFVVVSFLSTTTSPTDSPRRSPVSVTYEVTGDGTYEASITYNNVGGDSQQETKVTLPWSHTFTATDGHFLYVSAQNNRDEGSLDVSIRLEGETKKSSHCSGSYCIATASGRL